jgi:streptomycin 6-kinase
MSDMLSRATKLPLIDLPQTFLEMPRWWHEGSGWLAGLPDSVRVICGQWNLILDGRVMHGSNAIAVPVRRDGEPLVLRMTYPDDRTGDEIRALRFWDGRGTVRILDADPACGASLLERLDGEHTLASLPLPEALPIIARLMRRLAVPAPADARSTATIVQKRTLSFEPDWDRLGQPFPREILDAALAVSDDLATTSSTLAVNGDLHFEQVLRGTRESWLVVDPVLLRGDIDYDLARILWTRLDELATDRDVREAFETIVREAGLDHDRAHAWVLYRTLDYWLWGLGYGLTEDPVRCARLVRIFS